MKKKEIIGKTIGKLNNMNIKTNIQFPAFMGIKCNMMPFVQGDSNSLPKKYRSYSAIIDDNYLEKGKVGFLTIDESFVSANSSQRGYNNKNISRNVHIEVGRGKDGNMWGGCSWGGQQRTFLDDTTKVLISNSVDDTCRVWNTIEKVYTEDGDLSEYIDKYPESTGILLKAGQLVQMSIFTPHECVNQTHDSHRQFFRIVGCGVHGRESYFTINPLVKWK